MKIQGSVSKKGVDLRKSIRFKDFVNFLYFQLFKGEESLFFFFFFLNATQQLIIVSSVCTGVDVCDLFNDIPSPTDPEETPDLEVSFFLPFPCQGKIVEDILDHLHSFSPVIVLFIQNDLKFKNFG